MSHFRYYPEQRAELVRKFEAMREPEFMREQRRRETERIRRENAEWEARGSEWGAEYLDAQEVR